MKQIKVAHVPVFAEDLSFLGLQMTVRKNMLQIFLNFCMGTQCLILKKIKCVCAVCLDSTKVTQLMNTLITGLRSSQGCRHSPLGIL